MTCYEYKRKPKKDNFLTKHNRTMSQIIDNAKDVNDMEKKIDEYHDRHGRKQK